MAQDVNSIVSLISKGFQDDDVSQRKVNELMAQAQNDPELAQAFDQAAQVIKQTGGDGGVDAPSAGLPQEQVGNPNAPSPREQKLMTIIRNLVQENKVLRNQGGAGATAEPTIPTTPPI